MPTRHATIGSTIGLHARPASLVAQAVAATGLPVTIALDAGDPVDAHSSFAIMALNAKRGDIVTLCTNDDNAAEALDALVRLLERDLDAE